MQTCLIHNSLSTIPNLANFISICIRKVRGIQISHCHASLASSMSCPN
jgi:hypothetical protein